ncbi:iron-chelating periplasmic-binding protein [Gluconobacter morbifer G707]|uniref:Iron-chelating periplasmic-binding protein n=1 Tax=Gluconobacter morbifer G707 TaxID=1088869 RepID=G6XF87_9PROT|nr:iron-chelating periplasmic-binding protein [Gluconobacter morbifer G707]
MPQARADAAPTRIVEGWYAHNAMLIMLGAQDHIVATVAKPSILPWMFRLVPQLSRAQSLNANGLNSEELLKLDPDVVFVPAGSHDTQSLTQAGLHVVEEGFTRFDSMLDCVDSTATQLQTPLAAKRAQAYRLAFLQFIAQAQTSPQGPRVLHVLSLKPLQVDGDQTIIDQWIRSAGGRNAADGVHGNKQTVTAEQILSWNPDIIILAANGGDPEALKQDKVLAQVAAVKNGRVYRNPTGLFPWDRYGPELLLEVSWARQILQQGSVDEAAMTVQIRKFYHDFYDISLSASDALLMLHGQPPQ